MFLHLFDNHPQLFVYPTDINLFYAYFPVFVEDGLSREERIARLQRIEFDDLIERNCFGDVVDVEEFRSSFFDRIDGKPLNEVDIVLTELLNAFQDVTVETAGDKKYAVVKETSIEIYATEIAAMFPDARFIQLIRDPRDNFAAIRAGIDRYKTFGDNEKTLLNSMLNRALLGMRLASSNRRSLGENRYCAVRFEDVVSKPDETMRDLCNWLGIEFSDTMLVPSVLGATTAGNSYDNEYFFDISTMNVGRWSERILPEEAKIIEYYFSQVMEEFGYPKTFEEADTLTCVGDFYKWLNYDSFYYDRFAQKR